MFDDQEFNLPANLSLLEAAAARRGFALSSEPRTGALLRTLAASKPGGRLLEIGTGVGSGTAWLLDGMDPAARLITVEQDPTLVTIARQALGDDPRVTFIETDGAAWLRDQAEGPFDLIFADSWPGKFADFEAAWSRLTVGGLYVIDDLLPQASWPDGHAPEVDRLVAELSRRGDCRLVRLAWSSGLILAVRIQVPG